MRSIRFLAAGAVIALAAASAAAQTTGTPGPFPQSPAPPTPEPQPSEPPAPAPQPDESQPDAAQPADNPTTEDEWTGFYAGASAGYAFQPNDRGSTIEFDNNLDGQFGDTVSDTAGADFFANGFCNGRARSPDPAQGCANDKDGFEYYGNVGYDRQLGNFVVGLVGEFGKAEVSDSVSAFSITPASYTMRRKLKYNAGLRLRGGYTPNGSTLFYATGGGAYGKVNNSFATTDTVTAFADNGSSNAWGWSAGGGVDQKIAPNVAVGLLYLYTDLKDDDYRVNAGPGTATPADSPFLLANAAGTDFRRSDGNFRFHSIRATAAYRF